MAPDSKVTDEQTTVIVGDHNAPSNMVEACVRIRESAIEIERLRAEMRRIAKRPIAPTPDEVERIIANA